MIKYGLKEFARNIYSNVFIAVQLAIAFIIMTAAVSSVLSRIEMYTPVKKYFPDGKGLYICNIYDAVSLDGELKNIDDVESVTSGYDTSLYYSPSSKDLSNGLGDDRMSVNALSEDMIKSFTPQMSSGKWLYNASANGDLIPAVVTENSNYKTGDIVTIMHKEKVGEMSPDDEDFDYADPYKYEYVKNKVEIVGVIADGSQLLGFSSAYLGTEDSIKEKPDFRDLYANVNKHGNMMLIVPTDCLKDINCKIYPCGNQIVTLKDNVSNERFKELELYLRDYGRVFDFEDFRENSLVYINGQLIKLVPMLICVIVLVIVSSVSASAVNIKKRLGDYGIYYLCGAKWNAYIKIDLVCDLMTAVMAAAIAVCISNVLTMSKFMGNTVISFGWLHLIGCVSIVILNILISLLIPGVIMRRNTPNEILMINE